MNQPTVYLFMRSSPDDATSGVALRRLRALQALRDELAGLGITITAVPHHADLHVEITNVLGIDDVPGDKHLAGPPRYRERRRVLLIRLGTEDDRLEFVCSDGLGNVTAEYQAARRIHGWLTGCGRVRIATSGHLPSDLLRAVTTS
jgi:hypothetical protein